MITKNESGKLEYHTIPRYDIGPAHAWECRQPAQFMTTPSEINVTELLGGLSPALLYRLSVVTGMPEEEALQIGNPQMQNESNNQPCHFCHSGRHRFYDCPLAQDDSEETVAWLQQEQAGLQARLLNASQALNGTEREELQERAADLEARIESAKLFAPVGITRGNKTWHFNTPGTNWAEGECDLRDAIRALERLPPAPEGPDVRVPGDFDSLDDAVKQARSGQTIRVAAGEHLWGGEAYVPAGARAPHALEVAWEGGAGALPAGGCAHEISSLGDEGEASRANRTLRMQSPALLHGAWFLRRESRGALRGVSCYLADGGVPGHHIVRRLHRHEEEPWEVGRRFRPRCLTTVLLAVLGGPWALDRCDAFCLDGTALALDGGARVDLDGCRVGAAGDVAEGPDGAWGAEGAEGLAYVAVEAEGGSAVSLARCWVQLTQVAGVRLSQLAQADLRGCWLALNGGLGGAAVALADHAGARLDGCAVACGESASPLWPETAALEASVSSGSQGALELRACTVSGRLWLTGRRPRRLTVEGTEVRPAVLRGLAQRVSGLEQALASGMRDPVRLWGDSRHEIWWPRARMEALGYEEVPVPVDGTGQRRHAADEDLDPDDDAEEAELERVWVNRTRQIELQPWGWEGALADVYDTDALLGDDGRWPLREPDVPEQLRQRERVLFKRRRQERVAERTRRAELVLRLGSNSSSSVQEACREAAATGERGDPALLFWLRRARAAGPADAAAAEALDSAVRALSVTDEELGALRAQLAAVEVDEVGSPGAQEVTLGNGVRVQVKTIPPAVLSAIWPHWPLYPQDRDEDPSGDADGGRGAPRADGAGRERRPWEPVEAAVAVRLDNDTEVAALPWDRRWQLAEAGFLPYPDQAQLVEELRGRDVDAWFRHMAEPEGELLWIPVLRNYAASMREALPEAAEAAHERRRRLEAELAAMRDYLEALGISASLHLTGADWRTLYPHLDTRRVFNPPTTAKLERVQRRVQRLEGRLAAALAEELDLLLAALYPLAKRVEEAFRSNDEEEIRRLVERRGGEYPLAARLADAGLNLPFSLTEDGAYMVYDESLLRHPLK
jgi:hypothetical protein